MRELAQAQVGDGNEVGGGPVAARRAPGLLQQAVHRLDKRVRTMIEHAAQDALEVFLERSSQALEGVEPAAPSPADPALHVGRSLSYVVVRARMSEHHAQTHLEPPRARTLEVGALEPVHRVGLLRSEE